MSTEFDPYQQWLGIADSKARPNHYRLLGLRIFEDQPDAISAAAARLGGQVMSHLTGEHLSAAQRMLVEIETARRALLDPQAKAAYDTALRAEYAAPNDLSASSPGSAAASSDSVIMDADSLLPPMSMPAPAATPQSFSAAPPPPPQLAAPLPPSAYSSAPPPPPPSYSTGGYPASGYQSPTVYQATPATYQAVPAVMPSYPPAAAPMAAMPAGYPSAVPMATPAGNYSIPTGVPAAGPMPQAIAVPQAQAVPQAVAVQQSQAVPVSNYPQNGARHDHAAPGHEAAAASSPAVVEVATRPTHWRRAAGKDSSNASWLYIGIPVATVALVALVAAALNQSRGTPEEPRDNLTIAKVPLKGDSNLDVTKTNSSKPANTNTNNSDLVKPTTPSKEPDEPVKPKLFDSSKPVVKPPEEMPVKPATPPTPIPTPPKPMPPPGPTPAEIAAEQAKQLAAEQAKQLAAVAKALEGARFAMSKRDTPGARRQIEAARKADAAGKLGAEILRVETLLVYVEGFWTGVRQSIKALNPTDQTKIGTVMVVVVERDDEKLVLRSEGQSKTYFINDLPEDLAFGLADSWFSQNDPTSKLLLGSFYVFDPRGNRDKARALWQQASAEGKRDEVALLMPELDMPLVKGMDLEPGPTRTADGKLSLPGAAAQTKARGEVKQMYSADLAKATAAEQKAAVAQKMLARAEEPDTNDVQRYILLDEAISLLTKTADFDALIAAVEKQAERFAIDSLDARADALAEAAKTAQGGETNQALARKALDVSDEAVILEKVTHADRLVKIALNSARKGGNAELLKECSAREKDIRELKKK